MTDIVDDLRRTGMGPFWRKAQDAADKIERLREEIEAKNREIEMRDKRVAHWESEYTRVFKDADRLRTEKTLLLEKTELLEKKKNEIRSLQETEARLRSIITAHVDDDGNWVWDTYWRPIFSAPKDGTDILLAVDGHSPSTGRWAEGYWLWGHEPEPTHWMYLPEPPEET